MNCQGQSLTHKGSANANNFSRQDIMKLYLVEFVKHENNKALSNRGIPGSKKLFRGVRNSCL